jgi:serine/threonine protein kinase
MGVVWRAGDPETGERAALKTVRVDQPSQVRAVRREVRALSRLAHPGIVRVLDEGEADGVPWYAMELLPWPSLRQHRPAVPTLEATPGPAPDRGAGSGPWTSIPRALALAAALCEPLAYLHGEGFVHRDLKPDNVVLAPDGRVVLVDFGLALRTGPREALGDLERASGTLAYMAPEQRQGDLVDARADLYALGAVLYELLTGDPPYRHGATALVVPPSAFAGGVSPEIDAVVLRLLAPSPADRFGYASDVARALVAAGATPPEPR